MKVLVITLFLILPSLSWGQDVQKALEAYQRGSVAYEKSDYRTALKEWTPLALGEKGNASVQYTLGEMYFNGIGVLYDNQEAAKWHKLAAEQGFSPSQLKLSKLYFSGAGVIFNPVLAHMWSNIANSKGEKGSQEFMDYLSNSMSENQLEKAQELARQCVNKKYIGC